MLPTFLVIGASKAGTTSLYNYLRGHPQIFMSEKKEPQFFPLEFNWKLGLEWYERHFEGAGEALAVGEASTTYTRYPHSKGIPERIATVLPGVRLIYVVRHPVERMRSQFQQHRAFGWEPEPSIDRALLANPFYLNISRYAMQVEQYLEHVNRDQILIITSEALLHERDATMRSVFEHVGVAPDLAVPSSGREYNATRRAPNLTLARAAALPGVRTLTRVVPTGTKRSVARLLSRRIDPADAMMSNEVRRELEDRLREDVGRLGRYLNAGFDGWGIA